MDIVSEAKAHGGIQGVYSHRSQACSCDMSVAVFVPPNPKGERLPVLWYLCGLTCTHSNVMDKGDYRGLAAELGLVVVCPDTSPRGESVPDEPQNWQFGLGASFYLDATQAPYADNYRMYSHVVSELPKAVASSFPVDLERQGIFGHSMGGHGAIIIALKNPSRFRSCSAFAPICRPSLAAWSRPAFEKYLGPDERTWRAYDACALIEDGARLAGLLVDQGTNDGFLQDGLRPQELRQACEAAGLPMMLRMQSGYDHSYNFISTFMNDHLRWHADRLSC